MRPAVATGGGAGGSTCRSEGAGAAQGGDRGDLSLVGQAGSSAELQWSWLACQGGIDPSRPTRRFVSATPRPPRTRSNWQTRAIIAAPPLFRLAQHAGGSRKQPAATWPESSPTPSPADAPARSDTRGLRPRGGTPATPASPRRGRRGPASRRGPVERSGGNGVRPRPETGRCAPPRRGPTTSGVRGPSTGRPAGCGVLRKGMGACWRRREPSHRRDAVLRWRRGRRKKRTPFGPN